MNETWNTKEIHQTVSVGNQMQLQVDGTRDPNDVMFWSWRLVVSRPREASIEIARGDLREVNGEDDARGKALDACSTWLGDIGESLARGRGGQTDTCPIIASDITIFDADDHEDTPWVVDQHTESMTRGAFILTIGAFSTWSGGSKSGQVWNVGLTFYDRRSYQRSPISVGTKTLPWQPLSEARAAALKWAQEFVETLRNPFAEPSTEGS